MLKFSNQFFHNDRWYIIPKQLEIIEKDEQFCLYAQYATGKVCIDKSYNVWQMLDLKKQVEQ